MGQAKQRGTADQRMKEAHTRRVEALRGVSVETLRSENHLPDQAEFVGYIVWIPERDEFLVKVEEEPATTRTYAPMVDAAIRFKTWEEAAPHAFASNHHAVVGGAFDIGKQIVVIGGGGR